ncbi:MAG: carbonic anhydrase [Bacteroidales bacterium]
MKFGTVINCMDGRVQLPVLRYLKDHYEIDFFDSVTEAGPIRILTERKEQCRLTALKEQIRVSMEAHQSRFIAVVGHHDCAGNPADRTMQEQQIERALQILKKSYGKAITYVGLYVNDRWQVEEYLKLEP